MSEKLHVVCANCDTINRVPVERLAEGGRCGQCRQPLFAGTPLHLTKDNFAAHVERSDIPVVVDFWAAWCGPCRMMAPVMEQAAAVLEPTVRLAKVNTEEEKELAARFRISGIPTLILFARGREKARRSGAIGLDALQRWIQDTI